MCRQWCARTCSRCYRLNAGRQALADSTAVELDIITDFTKASDKIDFSAIVSITGIGDLTFSLVGGDTHITAAGGFDLVLAGDYTQGANQLDASDFVF